MATMISVSLFQMGVIPVNEFAKLLWGHFIMSMSFIAKIEEIILKFTKPAYMDSQEKINDFLTSRQIQEKPVRSVFKSVDLAGMQVFTFGDKNSKNTILYVHGGAYVNEINWQHYLYCLLLARKLDAYVLAPVYSLAPHHSCKETYDAMTRLYRYAIENHPNLTLMGDSAGGGFVLSFAQYLNTVSLDQPKHIVTFSPWVDISFSNPPYDSESDPILGETGLKEIGKSWAGNLDTRDYRVSPVFGDNSGLAKTLIFAGENEIFCRDIERYVQNLKRDNVDVKLIIGEGLFHIYPLFPVPEAKDAFRIVKKELCE